ncbi:MAG: hypothetical protein R6V19_03955 [Armatimonadota bacterium]
MRTMNVLVVIACLTLVAGMAFGQAYVPKETNTDPMDGGTMQNDYMRGTPAETYTEMGGEEWATSSWYGYGTQHSGWNIVDEEGPADTIYVFADVELAMENGMKENVGYMHFDPADDLGDQSVTFTGWLNSSRWMYVGVEAEFIGDDGEGNPIECDDLSALKRSWDWGKTPTDWAIEKGIADAVDNPAGDHEIPIAWFFREDNADNYAGSFGAEAPSEDNYEPWRSEDDADTNTDTVKYWLTGPEMWPAEQRQVASPEKSCNIWYQIRVDTVGLDNYWTDLKDGHYILDPIVTATPVL